MEIESKSYCGGNRSGRSTVNIDTVNIDTVNIDTVNIDTVNIDTVNIDTVNIDTVIAEGKGEPLTRRTERSRSTVQ